MPRVNNGFADRAMPNTGGWQDRHDAAWSLNGRPDCHLRHIEKNAPTLHEQAIVAMASGWKLQADAHKVAHGGVIGDDGVLGTPWLEIGKALRALLNGQTGRLDCGTVDAFILDTLFANGFSEDDL